MCTVSWVHATDGYHLFFNRDEQKTRGAERPVQVGRRAGTSFLAPADSDFGGTWIATNEFGLSVGMLNGYRVSRDPRDEGRADWRSRGLLPLDLIMAEGLASLEQALAAQDLHAYRPFVLLALAPGAPTFVYEWDGLEGRPDREADERMPLASSGVEQAEAQRVRAAHLRELRKTHRALDASLLARFHASHAGEASALSPCMHRAEAETRSSCHIAVSAEAVRFTHIAGAPCRTEPSAALSLPRRRTSAPVRSPDR